jgi:hypothetical protein
MFTSIVVTVALPDIVHELASVTVTVYVPAVKPEISFVVALLLQRYEYPVVPPLTVIVIAPEAFWLHRTSVTMIFVMVRAPGSVSVVEDVVVHPFRSVTVTV